MREIPERPVKPWAPPDYVVDGNGKVVGAMPGEHHNWGRWGELDQLGTANLLTPERAARAATLVRRGASFTLGLPIGRGSVMPGYRPPPLHLFGSTGSDAVMGDGVIGVPASDDYVVMALQASTQIDGLGHFGGPHDTFFNGFWAGLVTTRSGARRLGVHHVAAHGLVGRAVLLDVARHYGADRLMPGTPIGPDELDATAAAQNVTVAAGDIVLVRTGHLGWEMSGAKAGHDAPGLSARAIPWLAEHDVAMVGLDTSAIEVVPADVDTAPFPFHIGALRDLGLMLGELFDLDELAADCAADGVYEGMFIASALPVVNAVGSPINPIVIK